MYTLDEALLVVLQLVACGDFGGRNDSCSAIGYGNGGTHDSGGDSGNMYSGDKNEIVTVATTALSPMLFMVC